MPALSRSAAGRFGEDEPTRVDISSYDRQLAARRPPAAALPPVGAYLRGHGIDYRVVGHASPTQLRVRGDADCVDVLLDWDTPELPALGWRVVHGQGLDARKWR